MLILLFHRKNRDRPRNIKDVPRGLPPHLMRDIGFDLWPSSSQLPLHRLW